MELYQKIKKRAKGCRSPDVRIKINLFLLALKLGNVSEACDRRGFSRQFYYRWWCRFNRSDFALSSLEERSRRPEKSPGKAPDRIERAVRYYKRHKYGSRMIQGLLARQGTSLARSTICHILNGRKKVKKGKQARLKTHQKRYELPIPGQRLQMDVKYVPCLIDAKKTYTYVIIDECTRWRFARAYDSLDAGTTVKFLDEMLRHCPFPIHCIQTDNGMEFTYKLNPACQHVEHLVDRWCEERGIRHRLIPPGVKELNGKVERSHRIDMQYFYWKAPTHDLGAFNTALSRWITDYNRKRPHGGLGFLTPWERLEERAANLRQEVVPPELEQVRLKFLKAFSIRLSKLGQTKQDRQIQAWEQELKLLLVKIAA